MCVCVCVCLCVFVCVICISISIYIYIYLPTQLNGDCAKEPSDADYDAAGQAKAEAMDAQAINFFFLGCRV